MTFLSILSRGLEWHSSWLQRCYLRATTLLAVATGYLVALKYSFAAIKKQKNMPPYWCFNFKPHGFLHVQRTICNPIYQWPKKSWKNVLLTFRACIMIICCIVLMLYVLLVNTLLNNHEAISVTTFSEWKGVKYQGVSPNLLPDLFRVYLHFSTLR